MSQEVRILIVDDDGAQAEMVREFLRISGYNHIDWAKTIRHFWDRLQSGQYDIVLLDYKLPDGTGLDVLEQLKVQGLQIPVIMVTGQGNERIAVRAIQRGAADYLLKSGDYLATLPPLIRKTIRAHNLQQSIQRSYEKIRYQATLLNNVRDAIVVWDSAGRITYWNPSASVLYGWSAEERLGHQVAQTYLPAFLPPIKPSEDGDSNGRHIVRKYIDRNGKTIWVSSLVTALYDKTPDDNLIGYMDVSHDISRRVEMEQALRDSEARYRAIVEDYQTELICRMKPNGTLTFTNDVFCRYFGKKKDDLLGMNFMYFIPKNERLQMVEHLTSFEQDKPVATLEHQVNIPGQESSWLQRTDRAIFDSNGKVIEFQSVARDITDKKKMEEQIQAAQTHLIQAARLATIGEMASGVAHQIYNPLTTIIADAQILLRQLPLEQPGRESAEAIEHAGWRLQQVVQRLMEFSRPEADALGSASINETIQNAVSMVSTHIDIIGCRLETTLDQNLPVVRGNARQLENLWVNLLLLARDACTEDRGSVIRITSRAGSSNRIIVEVSDNGEPIPAEQLATIFEPNFIGPSSGRGTGLEISICREVVRQHGGQITANSAPDHDTIFQITLPAQEQLEIKS